MNERQRLLNHMDRNNPRRFNGKRCDRCFSLLEKPYPGAVWFRCPQCESYTSESYINENQSASKAS